MPKPAPGPSSTPLSFAKMNAEFRRTTASIGKAKRIRFIAEKIIRLPTLPTVVAKMMALVDSPKASARSLAKLIQSDQALTAKILKLANSAYYGFQRQVSTVNLAIVVVGFNAVKDMGLSVSVLEAFKDPGGNRHFDLSRFWEHAISVGVGTHMLAKKYNLGYVDDSFSAGLLHDVGKVIINQYVNDDFKEIMARVHEDDEDLLLAETTVLDTTHDRIGGWLAYKWNLPLPIVSAIEFHHNPFLAAQHRPLAALVQLADYLSRLAGIGLSGNKKPPTLSPEDVAYFETLNIDLSPEGIANLSEEFVLGMDRALTFVNLIKGEEEDPLMQEPPWKS